MVKIGGFLVDDIIRLAIMNETKATIPPRSALIGFEPMCGYHID